MELERRMQIYRNRDYAISVATRTNGEFIDKVFTDEFGDYYIVIWGRLVWQN